ncbi:MAG: flagellar biosynthesis protein FlhF [Phycisphaerales bacterium]|nr:MAG: flagellar biosynthesis protein FlhF [Phycisphaerales bacterium]
MASMNLKTFRAASMAEALSEVKRDLGPDAVILHTKTYREGGLLGMGARLVVEVTAADEADAGTLPRRRRAARQAAAASRTPAASFTEDGGGVATLEPPRSSARSNPADGFTPARFEALHQPAPRVPGNPAPKATGAIEPEPKPVSRAAPRPEAGPADPSRAAPGEKPDAREHAAADDPLAAARSIATRVRPAPVDRVARETLEDEIRSIKRMVTQVLRHSRRATGPAGWGPSDAVGDALSELDSKLSAQDVAPDVIERLIGGLRDELSESELADAGVVRTAALRRIGAMLPIGSEPPAPSRAADGRPTTIALLGPTGVGKTTTLAKLAATHKLRHGRKVGLITSDTYRIAAVEQLRTYANIIGLSLKVVLTPDEMGEACEAFAACDVILIDTAGRSQHDTDRIRELREFVEAARPHRRHLVLSAAAQEAVMLAAADRFGALGPDRLLLTKLDEAVRFGPVLNVASRVALPLGYVTSGQEVPDDIEPANADRLARLILDGRVSA